jgi:alkylhydroperoxidase family enzyme
MTQRVTPLTPEQLDDAQRGLYERIAAGPRGNGPFSVKSPDGSLAGPFGLMLLAPWVGGALSDLGEAIRYHSTLPARLREIAILAVAVQRASAFEWYAHERVGRTVGLDEEDFGAILGSDTEHWADPAERAAHRAALGLVRDRALPEDDYAAASAALGVPVLAELVVLVGYYDALALLMSAFALGAPEGEADPFA